MWVFPKIGVPGTPKSSILIGFSIINHPFWGTPILGNTHAFFSPTNFLSDVRKKKGTNLKHFLHPMAPQDRKLHLSGKEANLVESFIQKCPKNICFFTQQLHRFICYSPTHPPKCKCSSRFLVGDEVCAAVPCAHTPAASFAICGFHPLAHLASIIQYSMAPFRAIFRCLPAAPD